MEAAACIKFDVEPPRHLVYAWKYYAGVCTPPYGGGWLEWPVGCLDHMEVAYTVWKALSDYYEVRDLGKYKETHSQSQVDLVVSTLKMLRENGYK